MVPSEELRNLIAQLCKGKAPILPLLQTAVTYGLPKPTDTGGGGKPKSKPPMHMGPFNKLDEIYCLSVFWYNRLNEEVYGNPPTIGGIRRNAPQILENSLPMCERLDHTHPALVREFVHALAKLIKEARLMLGIDAPSITLHDSVCGECQGPLTTLSDASADVQCAWCGFRYERNTWAQITQELKLVNTEDAITYLMRDGLTRAAVKRALFRARTTGKIRNRGGVAPGEALWSLHDLGTLDDWTCPSSSGTMS